ncbi:TetR family transcriptional regulator [Priestia megaterium]|uniref:TetR family transcriptional regulator n=1 Tax=Priestia megaterium TaxID=1404 RepID=A0A3D8WZR0_PRIMG|nr:TetR/AcrR family transcriptional regulator [Priestia megaterium]MDH3168735.1 TetR/AcrR family transcriptional regulator C-terminal domain-containing protein [Priestia megaterium]RDZ12474.1 TetR family transcriptional regulator [Priestia megaterium]
MSKKTKLDPRIKRTNKYLRDALVELLKEKDVTSITIQEITEKAELTRGTFYLHYQDKQDFLVQSMNEVLEELIEQVRPKQDDQFFQESGKKNGSVSFLRLFEFIHQHADYFKVMLSDRGLPQFRSHMTEIVKKRVYGELISSIREEEGELDIPKDILISYITSAHIGVICSWLESDMKFSPAFMADKLTNLTLLGPIRVAGLENKIKLPY